MTTTYRNRYINRGILDDREINAGGLIARDLAVGLFLVADDQGRLTASVRWIWKEVFAHQDTVSLQACRKAFHHLASEAVRFVRLYRHDGEIYLMVHNWHKFQPQKIDRLRWSTLPAPPDWEPEKYLPPRLLEKWKEDEKLRTFVPPPISNEWISGDSLEPERRHGGSKMSPLAETRRRRNGATAEPLARVGTDERKRERTDGGRVDDTTRGDIAGVEAPAPDPADSPVLVVTTPQSNGSPDAL